MNMSYIDFYKKVGMLSRVFQALFQNSESPGCSLSIQFSVFQFYLFSTNSWQKRESFAIKIWQTFIVVYYGDYVVRE